MHRARFWSREERGTCLWAGCHLAQCGAGAGPAGWLRGTAVALTRRRRPRPRHRDDAEVPSRTARRCATYGGSGHCSRLCWLCPCQPWASGLPRASSLRSGRGPPVGSIMGGVESGLEVKERAMPTTSPRPLAPPSPTRRRQPCDAGRHGDEGSMHAHHDHSARPPRPTTTPTQRH